MESIILRILSVLALISSIASVRAFAFYSHHSTPSSSVVEPITSYYDDTIRSNNQESRRDSNRSTSHLSMAFAETATTDADGSTNDPKTTIVTPKPKYPTLRGSTVDSRKIITNGSAGREHLSAIRLKHILFASKDLASLSLGKLRSAKFNFDDLATQISNCVETRDKGGEIGWVSSTEADGENEHLDLILPENSRQKVLEKSIKPGDVVMVTSLRGYHLVQITDVMVDVRKMAQHKVRTKNTRESRSNVVKIKGKRGILGGALSSDQDGATFKKDLTYKIETMGCQMNLADSERMEGQLQSLGLRPISVDEEKTSHPDLVLLNTCSIRDHAEQKVYSYIGPHAKRKRDGEDVAIIVAGCVAQQEGEALLRRVPEVDLVMGPQYANRISDLLEDVSNGNQVVATEASHIMEDSTKPRRGSKTVAWVNIIYGCNERCTYCIVPTTRGVEQSRPPESIVQEVQELVNQGYKEVTLLGQNIDAYGRDMLPRRKFSDLLRTVGSVPNLKRLRFVTSHPRYMSLGVIDAVAETPSACLNFHVPFQSGSDAILHAMGRGHTRAKFLQIVDRIRERLPDASITADVIVGFPGETEEQFLDTLSLMEEVKFDSVNTAAYSPRPNTPAAVWDNQVAGDVKHDRLKRINRLNLQHAMERRARMQDRTVEVLVEERNVKIPTQVMGRTTHGYIVYFDGEIDELRGKLVHVKIEQCHTYYLVGSALHLKP